MRCRKKTTVLTLLIAALLLFPLSALTQQTSGKRTPLNIEGKKTLTLRVLSRAFSSIYKGPDVTSGTVEENVPAFQSFYVYDKKGSSSDLDTLTWYEVGTDNRGTVVGWMSSDDVFEWKQTMCLSYTHPEGRYPVLMFDKKESLAKLSKMEAGKRSEEVEKLYMDIAMGDIPPDFPVVTIEPEKAIDIAKEFYLLPILAFEEIELDNREARILQLAAVTKSSGKARESSDIRKNKEYLQSAVQDSSGVTAKTLEKLGIDIVWVMDTTNSMKPYINQTLKVVEETSKRISTNAGVGQSVSFGIWGYRDSMDIPGIGYNVKNYTPKLLPVDQFTAALKTVDITPSGSQGYAEDVFSGINGALNETSWTEDAIRVVILVGDAPSHEVGHKWNASGQSQDTLRAIANDRNITIVAFHIKDPDPRAEQYHGTAEEQFQILSTNPGVQSGPAYFSVVANDPQGFEDATKGVANLFIGILENAREVQKKAVQAAASTTKAPASDFDVNDIDLVGIVETTEVKDKEGGQSPAVPLAREALKAAFVQWIGSQTGAQAPRDVVAWVTDKDLLATDIQSLEVRLLLNKRQLDSLRETLSTILQAGRTGQKSGDDFFTSLQAAAATTARNPDMINQADSLAQTGLVPEFLAGLPYTSRIMDMNNELWSSWSIDDQDMFLADLEARIMAYETIHDSPEGWVQLNRGDDPGEYVYPITLELLP